MASTRRFQPMCTTFVSEAWRYPRRTNQRGTIAAQPTQPGALAPGGFVVRRHGRPELEASLSVPNSADLTTNGTRPDSEVRRRARSPEIATC